ncbi:hypothetical protein EIK77_000293 [Talaromyces pinophilus]|nr:hypothetical protein EIK77_000293 [Talaromyces pinophilus]PCG99381.1 Hypothetical protein PENO1_053350 [Penicillium occitanis (nom. inval.)]PCH04909.1 hypothetical protein PENOC_031360 [Penicillium occitanis (nom. inval.)]
MATSNFATRQYAFEAFVESCGAILFDLEQDKNKVCLIHHIAKNERMLAKGRQNCGESRQEAALRETREETAYQCQTHPVTMSMRAPPKIKIGDDIPDEAREFLDLTEPFMLTIRETHIKLIWWYIAVLDKEAPVVMPAGEADSEAGFFSMDEAVQKPSFQNDRDVLERAISLVGK